MIIKSDLARNLKTLRLSGMLATLPARSQQALESNLHYMDFLETLVADELDKRKDRLLAKRQKTARVNPVFRLDNFNFSFNPKIPKSEIIELATTNFIPQAQNAIFIGPPGTGKTHIAHAIALCAIQAGYSALCLQIFDLIEKIAEAEATNERKDLFASLIAPDLLVFDDIAIKRLSSQQAEDILEIIMRRYESKATIMISNRPIEDWHKVMGDAATSSAMLDRLMHHAHLIPFEGKSYRLEQNVIDKRRKD